jgi:hypothetical protein
MLSFESSAVSQVGEAARGAESSVCLGWVRIENVLDASYWTREGHTHRTKLRAYWICWIAIGGGGVIDLERVRSRFLFPDALSSRLPLGVLSID